MIELNDSFGWNIVQHEFGGKRVPHRTEPSACTTIVRNARFVRFRFGVPIVCKLNKNRTLLRRGRFQRVDLVLKLGDVRATFHKIGVQSPNVRTQHSVPLQHWKHWVLIHGHDNIERWRFERCQRRRSIIFGKRVVVQHVATQRTMQFGCDGGSGPQGHTRVVKAVFARRGVRVDRASARFVANGTLERRCRRAANDPVFAARPSALLAPRRRARTRRIVFGSHGRTAVGWNVVLFPPFAEHLASSVLAIGDKTVRERHVGCG